MRSAPRDAALGRRRQTITIMRVTEIERRADGGDPGRIYVRHVAEIPVLDFGDVHRVGES